MNGKILTYRGGFLNKFTYYHLEKYQDQLEYHQTSVIVDILFAFLLL